jgi:hypothetical protein
LLRWPDWAANESLDLLNPAIEPSFSQGHVFFTQQYGDPAAASTCPSAPSNGCALSKRCLFVSAAVAAVLIFLVLLMRRFVAEKGAHISAE